MIYSNIDNVWAHTTEEQEKLLKDRGYDIKLKIVSAVITFGIVLVFMITSLLRVYGVKVLIKE